MQKIRIHSPDISIGEEKYIDYSDFEVRQTIKFIVVSSQERGPHWMLSNLTPTGPNWAWQGGQRDTAYLRARGRSEYVGMCLYIAFILLVSR